MHKTLSDQVADARATNHYLLPAKQFLMKHRWTEDDKHLRVLMAIVKVWDEGGGTIDDEILESRFGIGLTDLELDQIVDVLVRVGLLERLNGSPRYLEREDTISVSARGLNLASELSWRRSDALLDDEG